MPRDGPALETLAEPPVFACVRCSNGVDRRQGIRGFGASCANTRLRVGNLLRLQEFREDADGFASCFFVGSLPEVKESSIALGQTVAGRYLLVVLRGKSEGMVRCITARPMTTKEKRYYRQRRPAK